MFTFRIRFYVNRNVTHRAFECLKSLTGSKLVFLVKIQNNGFRYVSTGMAY